MPDSEQNQPTYTPQQILRKRKFGQPVVPGEQKKDHRHIISVDLKNTIDALNRVTTLFSARGFNLESVAVGETHDPEVARLTIATTGNDRIIAQITRQLDSLVDTLAVTDLTQTEHVERELCLLKVRARSHKRTELKELVDIFRGRVVNVTPETMMLEVTGPTKKIKAFMGMLEPYGIEEVARSGRVAMKRPLSYEASNPLASDVGFTTGDGAPDRVE